MAEIIPDDKQLQESQKHYSEVGMWQKIMKVAKKAGIKVVYLALILYYTATASTTPMKQKGIIYGALGYFILPFDLIPDAIPIVGYSDDLAALIACVGVVITCITPEIIQKAQDKLHDWFGDYDKKDIEGLVK
ncbi:MAG: DUF1232 domain-containing protein [Bacteroidales bacterium]|jgi:uncharacterized membrane protein YkvA (DUF1232 family)|nr:DUF1232 domain-containing protein [Bacteroidales bacterium]